MNTNLSDRLNEVTIYVSDKTFSLLSEHRIDLNQYLKVQELRVMDKTQF